MNTYDTCIAGAGGVVGSAILRNLSARGLSVIGLEKHDGPARETSGLNSRVIHSGFHETRGTLKSRLALDGSRMVTEYARHKGIRLLNTGMLIAIPRHPIGAGLWRELDSVWRLWRGGKAQGVEFRWILSRAGVRTIAPIEASGGIFIPSVSVIDVMQLVTSLQRDALENATEIRYGAEILGIDVAGDRYVLTTASGSFASRSLINSAGLGAAEVSRMAGGPEYAVERIRGEYYELRGGMERWNIRTLVYPAMPGRSRSKGIHLGPRTDGRLFVGPDATPADSEPTPKDVFVRAARNFLPQITDADLEYAYAGIRPKYGSDFQIRLDRTHPPLVNLIGIDSPGLSSAMAIAEYAGSLLCKTIRDGERLQHSFR